MLMRIWLGRVLRALTVIHKNCPLRYKWTSDPTDESHKHFTRPRGISPVAQPLSFQWTFQIRMTDLTAAAHLQPRDWIPPELSVLPLPPASAPSQLSNWLDRSRQNTKKVNELPTFLLTNMATEATKSSKLISLFLPSFTFWPWRWIALL